MKYRKKPVVIEAFQFLGTTNLYKYTPDWFIEASLVDKVHARSNCLIIKTLEGTHRADVGDWIIQGVKGELYPCKPEIFELTYSAEED